MKNEPFTIWPLRTLFTLSKITHSWMAINVPVSSLPHYSWHKMVSALKYYVMICINSPIDTASSQVSKEEIAAILQRAAKLLR